MKIGIIGGVGAVATSIFFEKCLEKVTEHTQIETDSSFPEFVISSIPMQQGQSNGVFNSKDIDEYFIKSIESLNFTRNDVAVIACNTIQNCIPRDMIACPILDNVPSVNAQIQTSKVLVLASEGAMQNRVWNFPTVPQVLQEDVTFLIDEIMKNNRTVDIPKDLNNYLATLDGSTTLVLGCTELSILQGKFMEATHAQVLDSVDVMASELVSHYFKGVS